MTPEDDPELPEDWQVEALLSYDQALAEGRVPEDALTSLGPASSLDAVHRCQRMLEELWPRPTPAPPEVPRRFGRFEILRELGRGGFGVVFLAIDPTLGRKVALKVPRPEALIAPEIRRRFLREAEASSRLDHPHIVPVYEVGQEGAVSYIASAYCEGITLAQWLRKRTEPVPFRLAAQLVAVLAEAVGHAHARSILHRDLKPGNILLQPAEPIGPAAGGDDSLGFSPRICDFGLAKLLDQDSHETCSGSPIGSPCYMAPEQAAGRTAEFAAHTDVYALGVILFEVLTGRPPHRGETQVETLRLVAEEEPPPIRSLRSAIPRDLETVCLKCLAKRPGQRYGGALELADDLRRFLAGRPIQARPLYAWERAWKWARRRPAQAALVVGTAFGLACLIGVLFWSQVWLRRHDRDLGAAAAHAQDEMQRTERAAQEARLQAAREQFGRQYGQAIQVRLIHETLESGNITLAARMYEGLEAAPKQPEYPGFARAYLRRLFHPDVTRLAENDPIQGAVLSMDLSSDGRTLASGISDGTVILWDLFRRARIRDLRQDKRGDGSQVYHVAFSPDGRLLASGSVNGGLKLWDVATGRERDNLGRRPGAAFGLIFSDDSRDLIALWCDQVTESAHVYLWHIGEGDAQTTLTAELGTAELDTIDGEGRVTPGSFARAHPRPSPGVALVLSRLALLPDVSVLAVRPRPGELVLYGLPRFIPAGRMRDSLPIPTLDRNGLRDHSPAEFQRYTRLFHRARGSTASAGDLLYHDHYDLSAHSPADGRTMAAFYQGGGPAVVVNQLSGRIEAYYANQTWRGLNLVFVPDGRTLIVGGFHPNIHLWRLDDLPIQGHAKEVWSLAYSPDGRTLASASDDHTIKLWDASSGLARSTLEGHGSLVTAVAYSPDGRTLASASFDGTIRLWNAATGEPIRRLEGHSDRIRSLAFSPDGQTLASGGNDRTIRLWDLTGRRAHPAPLAGHTDRVFSVLFTRDGKTLISGSLDHTIRHWDWNQGRVERVWQAEDQVLALALSPAGAPEVLATGDPQGNVLLRDLATGRTLASLRGHALDVLALAFSPDGLTLASAGRDRSVRLWDPVTGQALLTLKGHDDSVHAATFSPDGQTLATASHDGVIRFWRAGDRRHDLP